MTGCKDYGAAFLMLKPQGSVPQHLWDKALLLGTGVPSTWSQAQLFGQLITPAAD